MNDAEETVRQMIILGLETMDTYEYKEFIITQLNELDEHNFKDVIKRSDHDLPLVEEPSDLDTITELIIQWAKARGIIPNGNTLTQAIKTLEEVHELIRAIDRKDRSEIVDAYGDTFVTLVIGAYLNDTPLSDCALSAYKVIEHRTGFLNEQGDFIRDKDA